ncbi:MAG: hypothetical protein ACJAZO_000163 [Myxococcota bacterium]|jgi:hypothetical protein
MQTIIAVGMFASFFAAMSIGVMVSGRSLKGSCGGDTVMDASGNPLSCGACPKKEQDLCPSDDPMVRLAQIGNPNPRHHH